MGTAGEWEGGDRWRVRIGELILRGHKIGTSMDRM
jgi:hypothetical protein